MEVEPLVFADPAGEVAVSVARRFLFDRDRFHAAVDLVRRCVEHHRVRTLPPNALEHVERAECVDVEVFARIGHRRGDRDLRREVIQDVDVGCERSLD